MGLIERQIEKKIVDKIKELNIDGVGVYGLWNSPTALVGGNEGGKESANQKAFVIVKVPSRGFDTFGICEAQFDIVISLAVRLDMCKGGDDLDEITEPIVGLLTKWNLIQSEEELEDFMVEDFYPGGVNVSQGSGPDIDRNNMTWAMTFNLVLRGTIGCSCQP